MQSFEQMFATDTAKETEGIEFFMADANGDGPGFVLARAGGANKDFEIAKERAYRNWRSKHGKRAHPSDDQHIEILIPVFAETVVKSFFTEWSEKDDEGNPTRKRRNEIQVSPEIWKTYNKDTAETLLRKLPRTVLLDLFETAGNYASFQSEDIAKN